VELVGGHVVLVCRRQHLPGERVVRVGEVDQVEVVGGDAERQNVRNVVRDARRIQAAAPEVLLQAAPGRD
jgi:hypothetical protein